MATNIPQWAQNLPAAVQAKIPEGATGCTKDGDVYIFTKDGTAISDGKYKADGSVWTAPASSTSSNTPTVSQQQITQDVASQTNIGNLLAGSGFNAGTDLSTSWMGGNYNINTNKLMGTAGLLGATSMIASEVPFGLGGLLGSLAMPGIMAGFMKSMSFNFNFDNMFTSGQSGTQTGTATLPDGFEKTNLSGVYKKDGKYYKQDDNKNWLECDDTGKVKDEANLPEGYKQTATEGIYRKGDDYMKYDAETRTYVACDKDGNKKVADATTTTSGDATTTTTTGDATTTTTTGGATTTTTTGGATTTTTTGNSGASRRTGGGVPQGWYHATGDRSTNVSGITLDKMKEAQTGANGRSAARYVLDQLLTTKGFTLTEQEKARLQSEIIKKNPSVFDSRGMLKANADLSKLDVPKLDWIEKNIRTPEAQRTPASHQSTTIRGRNGYYVTIAAGTPKYYNPKGEEISASDFKSNCPTIYEQAQSRSTAQKTTIRGQNGYYAVKDGYSYTYYNPQGKQITGQEFKLTCPTIYEQTQPRTRRTVTVNLPEHRGEFE